MSSFELLATLAPGLLASLVVVFAGAPVGALLMQRRLVWLGLVLPQVAVFGIAAAMLFQGDAHHHADDQQSGAFLGALVAVVVCLLGVLRDRVRTVDERTMAVWYIAASAATVILLSFNRHFEHGMLQIVRGELLMITSGQLIWLTVTCLLVITMVAFCWPGLLQVATDPSFLRVRAKRQYRLYHALFLALVATYISVACLYTGPLLLFAAMTIAPLAASRSCSSVSWFFALMLGIAGLGAFLGYAVAVYVDTPPVATEVVMMALLGGGVVVGSRVVRRAHRAPS